MFAMLYNYIILFLKVIFGESTLMDGGEITSVEERPARRLRRQHPLAIPIMVLGMV